METPNNNQDQKNLTNDPTQKVELIKKFRDFAKSFWQLFTTTLSFAEEVDKEATVVEIKKGIDFKGFNIWILIFSIIIASIGLNTNSTAVIIGAMLISPLMGPIMGVGLSLGTNDWKTLIRSGKSLLITVSVSLVTSTLYFLISPFGEAGDELVGRTHPELRDVFIAIFGGLAGIMALSRNKVTNVIPGVAIATALMPPLCTAGYGLANLKWEFFSGAFYLFLINSVYIALTSFIVIRYLKFPLVHLLDDIREKKIRKYTIGISILLVIPSIYTLWQSYQKNSFETNAKEFIQRYFEAPQINYSNIDFNDGNPVIQISLFGKSKHSKTDLKLWMVNDFGMPQDVHLELDEDTRYEDVLAKLEDEKFKGSKYFEDMYQVNLQQIKSLEFERDSLKNTLKTIISDTIPFMQVSKEMQIHFPEVKQFEYGVFLATDFKAEQSIPTFNVEWSRRPRNYKAEEKRMAEWLKVRLKLPEVRVLSY